jgi:hypothetical protein
MIGKTILHYKIIAKLGEGGPDASGSRRHNQRGRS